MAEVTTEQVIYGGRVQGVGFRYAVRSIAKHHPVKGYVKNLPEGSVELMVQGLPQAIDALVGEVASQFGENIRHCERRPVETPEVFDVFEIRF